MLRSQTDHILRVHWRVHARIKNYCLNNNLKFVDVVSIALQEYLDKVEVNQNVSKQN